MALGLVGRHQGANAAVALATVGELRRLGWAIFDDAVRQGLAGANCPARVEVVGRHPTVVVDAAHNVAAAEALVSALSESFTASRRVLIFATTRHKDYAGMLARLAPHFDDLIFTRYIHNPRSIAPEDLAAAAAALDRTCEVYSTPNAAWQRALEMVDADALICITGSFFLAAEMRPMARGQPGGECGLVTARPLGSP